jgi:hypothetical protein
MKNAEISGIVHYIKSAKISDILIEHNMKNAIDGVIVRYASKTMPKKCSNQ